MTQASEQASITTVLIDLLTRQFGAELPGPVRADTDIVNDLALESVQVMEFMVEVEDHYDIAIDLEALADVRTIDDLAGVVAALRSDDT